MNSLPYFPLSISRTHPLLFPLSAHAKRGNLLKYNASTPFFATAEKGEGGMSTCSQRRWLTVQCVIMKNILLGGIILSSFLSCLNSCKTDSKKHNSSLDSLPAVTLVPPMGWNSFDAYDCRINEAQFREIVDYMAENLLSYGWNYAVIDYIWWHPHPGDWNNPKRRFGHPNIRYAQDGKPLDPTTIDQYGRLLPAVERFPSAADGKGFKPLADYVHGKGMKFGIHIMRGIHRSAFYSDYPIKGTDWSARDIAEPADTCNWCNHMFGVDGSKEGAQDYYDSLFELYAAWEIDFVKVDDILAPEYHKDEIEMIRSAIDKCGRPVVLSLSPGEAPLDMSVHLQEHANMWRISADFWDEWDKLKENFDLLNSWSSSIQSGSWPDADMIPIGRISLGGRPHGPERYSKFTLPEHYTLLSLWMISRSPLMLGAYLPDIPETVLSMIKNPEVIAVNQKSTGNRQLFKENGKIGWIADDPVSGGKYIALFNLNDSAMKVDLNFDSVTMDEKFRVRDLWKREDIGVFEKSFGVVLESHGAGLYRLER